MPTPSAARSIRNGSGLITIDGPAGAGKSTVAQLLARRLGLRYLDTGATYRALAYEALARGIDPRDAARVAGLVGRVRVRVRQDASGRSRVEVDGQDVTRQIRSEAVTDAAAVIAQFPVVRLRLVALQRHLVSGRLTVAEGRDTGSFVFPKAAHKFFLTATVRVRAARRQRELRQLHGRSASRLLIARQLRARDAMDVRRAVGPLVRPAGAVVVDTSNLTARQVVDRLLRHVEADAFRR